MENHQFTTPCGLGGDGVMADCISILHHLQLKRHSITFSSFIIIKFYFFILFLLLLLFFLNPLIPYFFLYPSSIDIRYPTNPHLSPLLGLPPSPNGFLPPHLPHFFFIFFSSLLSSYSSSSSFFFSHSHLFFFFIFFINFYF